MRTKDAQKEVAAANPLDRERTSGLPLSAAEDELLAAVLAEPLPGRSSSERTTGAPAWRRGSRLAMGGAVAVAGVAAALVVSAGGDNTPAAFAVEPQAGGGGGVQILKLRHPRGVGKGPGGGRHPSPGTYPAGGG